MRRRNANPAFYFAVAAASLAMAACQAYDGSNTAIGPAPALAPAAQSIAPSAAGGGFDNPLDAVALVTRQIAR